MALDHLFLPIGFPEHCWQQSADLPRRALSARLSQPRRRAIMDEEALNTSVRKFLKTSGVTAQRGMNCYVTHLSGRA
jgi:hypothetical protein